MSTYTKKNVVPLWQQDVVDQELFMLIRHEGKEGHSKYYSAIFHEIEPETASEVLKASDYDSFCESRIAQEVEHEIASDWQ